MFYYQWYEKDLGIGEEYNLQLKSGFPIVRRAEGAPTK